MKKFMSVFIFSFLLISNAFAGLKIDGLTLVERVGVFATGIAENAGVVTDGVAMGKEIIARGEKAKVMFEKIKLKTQNIFETIEQNLPGYEGEDEVSYEEEMETAEENVAGTQTELETQNVNVETHLNERKEALTEQYSGKKKKAEENLETLKNMLANAQDEGTKSAIEGEIADLEVMLNEYNMALEDLENGNSQILENDTEYQNLLKQKEHIENQISEMVSVVNNLSNKLGLSSIKGMLKKDDKTRQAEYNAVITTYFLTKEEPEISEYVDVKVKNRYDDLINVMAESVVMAAEIKNTFDEQNEEAHRINDNLMGSDYQISSLGMQIQQTIQDIKILHKYNKLLIMDLKLRTALNMLNQDYRVKNYDKDPASLNLDNYIFDAEDITSDENEEGFLDNVKAK